MTTPIDSVVYEYDYAGRRVGEAVNGDTTNYLWDEFSRYENILFEYDFNGTNTAYTLLGNTVLSQRENGLTNYNLTDALGSVRVVSDDAGQVIETLDYSAFGEPLFSDSVSIYQFAGERYDEITGLYYLRARSYSPELGRFLSRDAWAYDYQNPVELNRYVYGANNPVRFTDPSGYSINASNAVYVKFFLTVASGMAKLGTSLNFTFTMNAKTFLYINSLVLAGFVGGPVLGLDDYLRDLLFPQAPAYQPPDNLIRTGSQENVGDSAIPLESIDEDDLTQDDDNNVERKHISLGLASHLDVFTLELNILLNPNGIKIYAYRPVFDLDNLVVFPSWGNIGLSDLDSTTLNNWSGNDSAFSQAVERAEEIHFNLEDVLKEGYQTYREFAESSPGYFGIRAGRVTATELLFIMSNKNLCHKTSFYEQGSRNLTPSIEAKKQICGEL